MIDKVFLRKIRKEKGIRQWQIAEAVHISPSAYNSYEKGIRTPPFETLKEIARYLDVPVVSLLEVEETEQTALTQKIARLSSDERNLVEGMVDQFLKDK